MNSFSMELGIVVLSGVGVGSLAYLWIWWKARRIRVRNTAILRRFMAEEDRELRRLETRRFAQRSSVIRSDERERDLESAATATRKEQR